MGGLDWKRSLAKLVGVFLATLLAWGGAAANAADEAGVPFGKGRMFEVSRPGTPPSYVFGTMHVTDEAVLRLPAPIARAFKGSQTLLVEASDSYQDMVEIARAMALPQGVALQQVIGDDLYEDVIGLAERIGLPRQQVDRLQPWALSFILSRTNGKPVPRTGAPPVLDRALQNYAYKYGIPVVSLDRGAEIGQLFSEGFTTKDQIAFLQSALLDAEEGEASYADLLEAYLAGDLAKLRAIDLGVDAPSTPEEIETAARLHHLVIAVRNERWLPRMQSYLRAGGAFVAVGAARLPGEDGILNLLEASGYQVKRVL